MGRGRAKAKQMKVARELKYRSQHMDMDSLRRDLDAQHDGASDEPDYEALAARYGDDESDDTDEFELRKSS